MIGSVLQFLYDNIQIQEEPTRLILLLPILGFVTAWLFLKSSIDFYKKGMLSLSQQAGQQQTLKLLRNAYLKIVFLSILLSCLSGPLFFSFLYFCQRPASPTGAMRFD